MIIRPDVCTDCILARITVINVIAGDYGTYVLRATSEQAAGYYSDGRVKLYQTPECQQSITNPGNLCFYNLILFNLIIFKL